jgi:hypothetical protein
MYEEITLDMILNATLLRTAVRQGKGAGSMLNRVPDFIPVPAPASNSRMPTAERPIWTFSHAFARGKLNEVTAVRCGIREMGYPLLTACDSIHWSDVSVATVSAGGSSTTHTLPLTSAFHLLTDYAAGGAVQADGTTLDVADQFKSWAQATHNADGARVARNQTPYDDVRMDIAESWGMYGPQGFWVLPMQLDIAFQHVFGYELLPGGKSWKKVDRSKILARHSSLSRLTVPGQTNRTNVYEVAPLRVIVVTSLVLCKESGDFTPRIPMPSLFSPFKSTTPVGVARLLPLTMVWANQDLQSVLTKTTLMRPRDQPSAHCHGTGDGGMANPGLAEVVRGRMNGFSAHAGTTTTKSFKGTVDTRDWMLPQSISASMYSDRNYSAFAEGDWWGLVGKGAGTTLSVNDMGLLAPRWDLTFAYYDTDPAAGFEFTAVFPRFIRSRKRPAAPRQVASAGVKLSANGQQSRAADGLGEIKGVRKLPGQGLFDNLHLAPKMTDPQAARMRGGWGFEHVSMAPFCVHDCFHTHWRWAAAPVGDTAKWDMGWSQYFRPNAEAGATMVPPNQRVKVVLKSSGAGAPTGFEYKAEAIEPEAQRWQPFFHHGSAYAAFIPEVANMVVSDFQPPLGATGDRGIEVEQSTYMPMGGYGSTSFSKTQVASRINWALFYWYLRYDYQKVGATGKRVERCKNNWREQIEVESP